METDTPIHRALEKYKSQQALASAVGVSQVAIHKAKRRAEAGELLSPKLAARIADVLGIPRHEVRPDLWPAPEHNKEQVA